MLFVMASIGAMGVAISCVGDVPGGSDGGVDGGGDSNPSGGDSGLGLIRFKPDGTQDTNFGAAGMFLSDKAGNDIVVGTAQDPVSKKILLMGRDGTGRLQMYRVHP